MNMWMNMQIDRNTCRRMYNITNTLVYPYPYTYIHVRRHMHTHIHAQASTCTFTYILLRTIVCISCIFICIYALCTCMYMHRCLSCIYVQHTRTSGRIVWKRQRTPAAAKAHASAATHSAESECIYVYMYIYIYTNIHICLKQTFAECVIGTCKHIQNVYRVHTIHCECMCVLNAFRMCILIYNVRFAYEVSER